VGSYQLDDGLMEAPGVLVRQVRKRRSAAEKRLIVEQALEPGASVARVARAHGLNANVVFHWRRLPLRAPIAVERPKTLLQIAADDSIVGFTPSSGELQ
jgi:transposase-like protein